LNCDTEKHRRKYAGDNDQQYSVHLLFTHASAPS
jgi:hypothetical protein